MSKLEEAVNDSSDCLSWFSIALCSTRCSDVQAKMSCFLGILKRHSKSGIFIPTPSCLIDAGKQAKLTVVWSSRSIVHNFYELAIFAWKEVSGSSTINLVPSNPCVDSWLKLNIRDRCCPLRRVTTYSGGAWLGISLVGVGKDDILNSILDDCSIFHASVVV